MTMKKKLLTTLSVVLILGLAALGILAYLTDTDSDVNVMTLGNVSIEQIEQERNANGELVDFTQNKALYPAVYSEGILTWDDTKVEINGTEYNVFDASMKNVLDKIVTVKNTGKSDAYVRTVIAFESPEGFNDELLHINYNSTDTETGDWEYVTIEGNRYVVTTFTYKEKLAAGATSAPSLMQVYLDPAATNEDVAACDGNGNGTYDILVLSQAVQTEGFADAATALETAFPKGDNNANVVDWFAGAKFPGTKLTDEERGNFMAYLQTVEDGTTIYLDSVDYGKINLGGGHFNSTLPKNITIVGKSSTRIDFAVDKTPNATVPFDGAMEGWTFKNVTFYGDGFRLQNGAAANNIQLEGCNFIDGATFYSLAAYGGKTENATFNNCHFFDTVENAVNKNAISIQDANNITITGCTFSNVRNAVNFGSSASGNMVITGNTVNGSIDRVFRITNTNATYTITGNNITSDGDDDNQLMLAKNISDISVISLDGNTWNGKSDSAVSITLNGTDYIIK